jgi:hypothetical protein
MESGETGLRAPGEAGPGKLAPDFAARHPGYACRTFRAIRQKPATREDAGFFSTRRTWGHSVCCLGPRTFGAAFPSHVKRIGTARHPLRKGESLHEKLDEPLAKIQGSLVQSFFAAPSVVYIFDC